jgi:hypothetical protein
MNYMALGSRLRTHREAQGLSLDAIAKATKIPRSLLADLERGDLSRWPPGIYGRGFVREYAKTINYPAEGVLEEVCGFLLDAPNVACAAVPTHQGAGCKGILAGESSELRLMLAAAPTPGPRAIGTALIGIVTSLALVLVIGYVVTMGADVSYWTASGITALVWYPGHALYSAAPHALRRRLSPTGASSNLGHTERVEVPGSLDAVAEDPAPRAGLTRFGRYVPKEEYAAHADRRDVQTTRTSAVH